MKKIIVTTDLSEPSHAAFAEAAKIAKSFKSQLTVLAVIEDPSQAAMIYALDFPIFPESDIQQQMVKKVREDLTALASKHFPDLPHECVVIEARGTVHNEIINFAKATNADLIVMATRGRTGISRLLIGSVAERVVRESECPVLTVPKGNTSV